MTLPLIIDCPAPYRDNSQRLYRIERVPLSCHVPPSTMPEIKRVLADAGFSAYYRLGEAWVNHQCFEGMAISVSPRAADIINHSIKVGRAIAQHVMRKDLDTSDFFVSDEWESFMGVYRAAYSQVWKTECPDDAIFALERSIIENTSCNTPVTGQH